MPLRAVRGGLIAELRCQVAEIECLTSTHEQKTAALRVLWGTGVGQRVERVCLTFGCCTRPSKMCNVWSVLGARSPMHGIGLRDAHGSIPPRWVLWRCGLCWELVVLTLRQIGDARSWSDVQSSTESLLTTKQYSASQA